MIVQDLTTLKQLIKDNKTSVKELRSIAEEVQDAVENKCSTCLNYATLEHRKVTVHCCNDNWFTNVGYHIITDITLVACDLKNVLTSKE